MTATLPPTVMSRRKQFFISLRSLRLKRGKLLRPVAHADWRFSLLLKSLAVCGLDCASGYSHVGNLMIESELEASRKLKLLVARDYNHAVAISVVRIRSEIPCPANTISTTMLVWIQIPAEVPILVCSWSTGDSGTCNFLLLWRGVPTCRESLGKVFSLALKRGLRTIRQTPLVSN